MESKTMDTQQRLISNIDQLTKRVDELAMRVALVENNQEHFDEKMQELRTLIIEKNTELRTHLASTEQSIRNSIQTWNKIGLWLLATTGGVVIVAFLNFVLRGGLAA